MASRTVYRPVQPLPFLVALTRLLVASPAVVAAVGGGVHVDVRGDTDDVISRLPLVVTQVVSAQDVAGSGTAYGAALLVRARWVVVTQDTDQGAVLVDALTSELVESHLQGRAVTPEGTVSGVWVYSTGMLGNETTTTDDVNYYQFLARMVVRQEGI